MARREARFSRPSAKSGSADLVSSHAHWFDLSGHGEEIDLAGLDVVLGELKVFSSTRILILYALFTLSNREARLTVSPITLKDRALSTRLSQLTDRRCRAPFTH